MAILGIITRDTLSDIITGLRRIIMAQSRRLLLAPILVMLLLTTSLLTVGMVDLEEQENLVEVIHFEVSADTYNNLNGHFEEQDIVEERQLIANSRLGVWDNSGLEVSRPLPAEYLEPRADLSLLIVDNSRFISDVRQELNSIRGLEVKEFISPSGLIVQGTFNARLSSFAVDGIDSVHEVPISLLLSDGILDTLLLEGGEEALEGQSMRIDGWRNANGPTSLVNHVDRNGDFIIQDMDEVIESAFTETTRWESGRWSGSLDTNDVLGIMRQPSVMYLDFEIQNDLWNDRSRVHMGVNNIATQFTTNLNGSGITVAVADSGLDDDHGDFGNRIVSNTDVIGDGSTADGHSGHGTHVACTVLGDGTRGGYAGVAPEADLIFQAMERDSDGQFLSPSLNYIMNQAYSNGARIHTNSWGSSSSADFGKYTSQSEDVDDRAHTYDRYSSGYEGLVILFAAGNDGPNTGTVGAPGTAKNSVTVGNHQNRYGSSPDAMMSGSSRGPTDDGRIKPDVVAPGGYVRSCRAQEAMDTGGATWSNNYYLEYTGTSMATPNAAGVSALIREYLVEIAGRPEPQGALVKALLVLGAEDIGARDIPNDDEGWGRINVKNTLAPSGGRGIWVDDRSKLSRTGNSKSYIFNVTYANSPFKAVLAWSDERGSRFSTNQLVNNLNLKVISPDGTEYWGNNFANGRSIQGGSADTVNNLEVFLVDSAAMGIWEIQVIDGNHAGSSSQMFALAVSGQGVNDLRPDPMVVPNELTFDVSIPQVGDEVEIRSRIQNAGNVESENLQVSLVVDNSTVDTQTINLGPGGTRDIFWTWTPTESGQSLMEFKIDPNQLVEEIREDNNIHSLLVNVTAPGVKVTSENPVLILDSAQTTTSRWNVSLQNTALIPTNASLSTGSVTRVSDGYQPSWYLGSTNSNFTLQGRESANISVTLVHNVAPQPGTYMVQLTGFDVDNSVTYPTNLTLIVPALPDVEVSFDYASFPVHPVENSSYSIRFTNLGNDAIGYDLFLEAPTGWSAGFDSLSSQPGATSGSTGLITENFPMEINLTFTPPTVKTLAGAERIVRLTVISQTDSAESWVFDLPLEVIEVKNISINLESGAAQLNSLRPDSRVNMVFYVENIGNVDLNLTPSLRLPLGWTVVNSPQTIDLGWVDSFNFAYTIEGDGTARSGEIELRLDDQATRFTWSRMIEVQELAEPSIQFGSVTDSQGNTWNEVTGPSSYIAGEVYNFTWLVSNDADVTWIPTLSLIADNGLFGDCSEINEVTSSSISAFTCSVVINNNVQPNTELGIRVQLSSDGIEISDSISILIASVKSVEWTVEIPENIGQGSAEEIQVRLVNTGNSLISSRLLATASGDWDIEVTSSRVIEIQPGDSASVEMTIIPGTGSSDLRLWIEGDDIVDASLEIELTSQSSEDTALGIESSFVIIPVIACLVLLILLVVRMKAKGQDKTENFMTQNYPAPQAKITPQITPSSPVPAQQIQCWACRNLIIGKMKGCPGCGARYHLQGMPGCNASSLATCNNCSTPSSEFLDA